MKRSSKKKSSEKQIKNKVNNLQKMKNLLRLSDIGQGRFRSRKQLSFVFELEGTNIKLLNRTAQEVEVNNFATLIKLLSNYKIKILSLDEKVNLHQHIKRLEEREDLTESEEEFTKELHEIFEGTTNSDTLTMKKFYIVISGVKEVEYNQIVETITSTSINVYELSTNATRIFTYNLLQRDDLVNMIYLDENLEFPANIKNNPLYITLNEKYVKTIMVTALPKEMDTIGLINKLHDVRNVNSVIEIHPANIEVFKQKLNKRKNYNNGQLNKNKITDYDKTQIRIENDYLDKAMKTMTDAGDLFYKFEIFIQLTADSLEELNKLTNEMKSKFSQYNVKYDMLELEQLEGFLGSMPWLSSNIQWKLNTYTSPIASLFPHQISTVIDDDGVFLGRSSGEELIILDLFSPFLTNPNVIVVGSSGNGKSIILKKFILGYAIKLDTQVFVFDSDNHEYVDLTKNCGGEIINPGVDSMINIFEIRRTGIKLELDELGEIIKDEYSEDGNSIILDHISWLKEFFRIYYPDITTNELIVFEKLCMKLYEQKSITDMNVHEKTSKDFPIVTDMWNLIVNFKEQSSFELFETPIPRDVLDNLQLKMSTLYNGSDRIYFNGHTTLETNSKIVNFDILALQSRERRVQQAVLFMYINYIWDYIESTNNSEIKKLLIIDELYLLVNKENPMMVNYVNNIQKRMRKYSGGTVSATQQLGDLNDPAIRAQTMSILSNPALKIIHNVGEADSLLLKSHLNMADHEIAKVMTFGKLNALIKYNRQNYHLKTHITKAESKMFGTAGMSHGQR